MNISIGNDNIVTTLKLGLQLNVKCKGPWGQ